MTILNVNNSIANLSIYNLSTVGTEKLSKENDSFSVPFIACYCGLALSVAIFNLITVVAVLRTKRTPYSTRILSSGLLVYDILFLIFSSATKFRLAKDLSFIKHINRGLSVSSYIIIGSMALERYFVFSYPYVYLKVATNSRIRRVCAAIFIVSFLQYVLARGIFCYLTNGYTKCGLPFYVYAFLGILCIFIINFVAYYKIHKHIHTKVCPHKFPYKYSEYKSTAASLMYVICTTISGAVYISITVVTLHKSITGSGPSLFGHYIDVCHGILCIINPLIYVHYFKESRFELLKMIGCLIPNQEAVVCKMRIQIFDIQIYEGCSKHNTGTVAP